MDSSHGSARLYLIPDAARRDVSHLLPPLAVTEPHVATSTVRSLSAVLDSPVSA